MNTNSCNSKINSRLNRVEGQVKAIRKMIDDERDCIDVVTQIAAARSALARIARDLLTDEACACARSSEKQNDFDNVLKKLFDVS